MKSLIILLCLSTLTGWSKLIKAEAPSKLVDIGVAVKIDSKVYQQTREIQVYLPENYNDSNKHYPVLYLLDGQRWFLQGVSLIKNFREYDYVPDVIVVGVNTNDNGRWRFFNQSENLAKFLEVEVTNYIDKHYRTSSSRLLFGWQFAGSFALTRTIAADSKFDGFIIASPFPVSGQRLEQIKLQSEQLKKNEKFLFLASHPKEASVADGTKELNEYLIKLASDKLRWHYFSINSPVASSIAHRYSPIDTLFNGVLTYFDDYANLEFDSISDFQKFGGILAVEKFYINKAEKYGTTKQITQEGMFNLVRLAMRSDNLSVFDELLENFSKYQFLNNSNLSWASSYADFYLQKKQFKKSAEIYQLLVERFPKSPRPLYGLGKAFEGQQLSQKAIQQYQLAIDIAEKVTDANIKIYQQALADLNKN